MTGPSDRPRTRLPGTAAQAALALLLSLGVFVCAHWKGFTSPYAINDDLRQQVYWMQRFADPDLYPPELLNAYAQAYVTYGVELAYRAESLFRGPFAFSVGMTGVLFLAQCGLLFALGLTLRRTPPRMDPEAWNQAAGRAGPLETRRNRERDSLRERDRDEVQACLSGAGAGAGAGADGCPLPAPADTRLAWAMTAACWLMPFFLDNISGALARGYASPLLALFVLSVLRGGQGLAALGLQAAFIPYIFLPCALAATARRAWAGQRLRAGGIIARLAGAVRAVLAPGFSLPMAAFTLLAYANAAKPQGEGFGPLVWLSETAGRPEFGPLGRLDLVPLPNPFLDLIYFPFERIGLFLEFGLAAGIVSLVFLAGLIVFARRTALLGDVLRRLAPLGWLAASCGLFYVAARLAAFKLFVPDRYLQYPLNLFYAVLLGAVLAGCWTRLARRVRPGRALIALALVITAALGAARLRNVALYDYADLAGVYAGVEAATPKNALIAGHPEVMDNVMSFARRNALATFELAHPWNAGFWERISPRLEGFLQAYYAADPAQVRDFARRFRVDFLLVSPAHFTDAYVQGRILFEPYGSLARGLAQSRGDEGFAVLDSPEFTRIPLGQEWFLIDLREKPRACR